MVLDNTALQFLGALTQKSAQVVFTYKIAAQRFLFLNPAFEKLWELNPALMMEDPASLLETIHPEDQAHVQEIYQELMAGVTSLKLEFRIIPGKAQTEKWVCLTPFLLTEKQVIVGYAEDITAQKEYNDVLKKYANKKNSILNIISHDLAGSLGMISNLAHMLETDTKVQTNEEERHVLHLIEKTSRHGTKLLQDFMSQEFLESSQAEVIKRRIDLAESLRYCMVEYQQTQHLTGKIFHYHTTGSPVYLALDDNKFMQVINNLISNSIKFTPDGGEISVTLEEKEDSVLITIQDNGIGIPEKHHANLFEKFSPARRTGIKGEPSIGLGMSIIKTIVEWHQGKIWFESQENKGTTFYLELPTN